MDIVKERNIWKENKKFMVPQTKEILYYKHFAGYFPETVPCFAPK